MLPDVGVDLAAASGGSPAATYLNNLTINTSAGAGGTAGSLSIRHSNFFLDDNGASDPGSLTVVGGGNVILNVATGTVVAIETERGATAGVSGGPVDFGTSAISATAAGVDLRVDTANTRRWFLGRERHAGRVQQCRRAIRQ